MLAPSPPRSVVYTAACRTSCVARRPKQRAAMVGAPFARLLANLVVMGGGVLGRAFVEAYKQALQSARWQPSP